MVATNGVFNFSTTIKKHAYIVGVSESIAIFLPLLLLTEINDNPFFSQLRATCHIIREIAVFATVFRSISTLFFWIGFLMRVRGCLAGFLVFLVLHLLASVGFWYAAVLSYSKVAVIVLSLVSIAFHAYEGLVVVQLSESMLNIPKSIFEENFERLEEQRAPEEQKAEMKEEK